MAVWECIVCGLIYDESKGWPDDGIPPGTKWEDVPEDWLCPDCGVGKEDFELLEDLDSEAHVDAAHSDDKRPIIIIGTGLAGYNLARELRKLDADIGITMITSDDGRAYSKPMLSTGYTKNKDADALAMNDADGMASQLHIDIKTFTEVTAINTQTQQLTIASGEHLAYSKLVIAWGADTIRPPLKGDAVDAVLSINDLLDYDKFRSTMASKNAKKIVIIGGGLIGCEFTNDLLNGGFTVETIDPLGYCLPTLLPEPAGKAVQQALESQGARFHFGALATEVNHRDGQLAVTLDNDATIQADVVISAVGVRPRTELAQAAGINCERGIVTNRLLETSAANVYALGDCAEVNGHVLFYVAPLMACAKALAHTLTGNPTEVEYPAMPVTIKTPTCPVVVAPPAKNSNGEWHIDGSDSNVCAEFRNAEGALLGFALTGTKTAEKLRLQKELPAIF